MTGEINPFQVHRLLCMGVSPGQRRSHDHRDREPLPAGGALTCSERSEPEKERGYEKDQKSTKALS